MKAALTGKNMMFILFILIVLFFTLEYLINYACLVFIPIATQETLWAFLYENSTVQWILSKNQLYYVSARAY